MAVAPLESSSTPPDATLPDTTRSACDPMEEIDPQSTRKRPRLDSGSGACESLSVTNETSASVSESALDAHAIVDEEAPLPNRPASRMTINMKSPTTPGNPPPTSEQTPSQGLDPNAVAQPSGDQATTVVSLPSSPAQSPEIEVAELEDMDQDPNTTSWKPLGEALRDPLVPDVDVVQLRDAVYLPDHFPTLDQERDPHDNLLEICALIQKGSEHDTIAFTLVKQWLDEVVNSLDQLTHETFIESRHFWDDVPRIMTCLLRRVDDFQSEDIPAFWKSLEEFYFGFTRLSLRLIHLDTLLLKQLVNETDLSGIDLISRQYIVPLQWSLSLDKVPFHNAMQRKYGPEASNMIVRLIDRIIITPLNGPRCLSEYASCITTLIPRWPQLSSILVSVLEVAHILAESGNDQKGYGGDSHATDSPSHQQGMSTIYSLVRSVDEHYQAHITKKSPWVTNDTSAAILRNISLTYRAFCYCNTEFASQVANDLSIHAPEGIELKDLASVVFHGWRFNVLKKHIMDGRMELRVIGIETMQLDFVDVYQQYMRNEPVAGIDHPLVQFMVKRLRESRIVEYIVGIGSHPQLIGRSFNVVGFLVVTHAYADSDTDIIWKTVTESPDPRTVSEVLGMVQKTLQLHPPNYSALHYLCSKMLELPLPRFDARVVEFCDQVFQYLLQGYNDREGHLDTIPVDIRPLRLCVRLIRESAASDDLAADHKALLQRFAAPKLSSLMDIGLSDVDKLDVYELCVQDIAEKNQFSVGSIQALYALLGRDCQEMQKLAIEFNITPLIVSELVDTVEGRQTDFAERFSRNGFFPCVQMISRIIEGVPDSITPDLGDILWQRVFMSQSLNHQGRRTLWEMLCGITRQSLQENPFIDRCIHHYLPGLSPPTDYFPEVLSFAKTTIGYEIRFSPPPAVNENQVIKIPGMDRIWRFILTAPRNSIEFDAITYAIEVYLDHSIIHRSPRSAVETTHMALVDRCVDNLKSVASKLKSRSAGPDIDTRGTMTAEGSNDDLGADELKFSRSLLFLRQFLQALRTRPQYSPPQHSPPNLPAQPLKGELIEIRYQAFDGGSSSRVRSLQIGDLSTATELVETLTKVTGFPKIMTIYAGHRVDLLERPDQTLRDLKLGSGLLIVRKDPSCRGAVGRRAQPLTSVDTEVLKHFDDLYELLNLDDHLAREIYEFLRVFPPQEKVVNLVKSTDQTAEALFPMARPYSFLYSVNSLSECLREESLESSPNEAFVSHSVQVTVTALTRSEILESLTVSPTRILLAISLTECLYYALLVKSPVAGELPLIPNPAVLVAQLLRLMDAGQNLSLAPHLELGRQKLVCHAFSILVEGSFRDPSFWATVKEQIKFDQLIFSLLLGEWCQPIRKGIAETIALVCSSSKHLKKMKPPASDSEAQLAGAAAASENPVRIDMLATIWDALVLTFPRVLDFSAQSQEFFEIAHSVFSSVAERSPHDLIFSEYLKQWSDIMLRHRTTEFIGREPVDHLILGFSRLLKSCLNIASSSNVTVDTFNLTEQIFDNYLFPDLSEPSSQLITPQTPVMHTQTRQELYSIAVLLSKYDDNYAQLVGRLEDIIPQDQTYQVGWSYDRQRLIRSPEGYAGLKNLSNTCYLNSLLSQLFMNIGFRGFMLGLNLTDVSPAQRLLDETKKVFGYMQESWLKSVDPQDFVDSIRTYDNEPVDVTVQMDVDEFYNLLFDRWEAQISNPEDRKKFRSFYGGQLVQQIKSKECPHISERLEPFSAIQCDIKGKASLQESLQAYVEGEIMQGDNKYSCTSCGRHVDAVKRACLKDVPDNLIFHLKRFDFDMVSMMRSKINDEFQFPEKIDMAPFTVQYLSDSNRDIASDVFELVGVLVHSGTAESGHYYSYVRERPMSDARGRWVEFNDSDVSRFDPGRIAEQCFGGFSESVHSASVGQVRFNKVWNAYMLFYQRVSSMDAARPNYTPEENRCPVRIPLPVSLANHIAMENELFVRTYCLLDPLYSIFVRCLFTQFNESKLAESKGNAKLDKSMIFIALDTLEQLVTRTKEVAGFDSLVGEIYRVMNEFPKGCHRILQWAAERSAGVPRLVKSPFAPVRNTSVRLFVSALSKLREQYIRAEDGSLEKEKWNARYLDGLDHIVAGLESLWPTLHNVRAWDDYFEFLLLIAEFGSQEAGVLLDHGFLLKCLEMVWLDSEDAKRLKRQYAAYFKLLEKGRKFSHRRLMDLMSVLLERIDLTVRPILDDERQPLPDGRFSLTITESEFIRPLGTNGELSFLKKVLQQHSSPAACRHIVTLLMDAEPDAGLMEPVCQVLEDGLRFAPAECCTPFLEASVVFCRTCPDEDRIVANIDYVAKGVETINNSGGKEHLAFFTSMITSRNERLGLDETWFKSQVVNLIPDWAPSLLMYPDRAVRSLTMDVLRRILFDEEAPSLEEEPQPRHTGVAKELASASVEKLRKTYLAAPRISIEAKALEAIRAVVEHCLATYFTDLEEDQKFVRQAQMVLAAIEEMAVELPEELASEEWEDNSMVASDSEMGMAGTP
ncbi:putative ubiquitin C-terminal hydrolase [Aspergillus lucknowensis]|uniref:USP domain-containing protein n=1 Tax=Aspergillus lucknowensis TaxID=176173 RepID=A0ABR4M7U0_9EURO